MSSYEDYARAAPHYDATRAAAGVEVLLGCLTVAGRLEGLTVVDAGCGTGNYARAVAAHVARVEAVDACPQMLARARAKLADEEAAGRVAFHNASIEALPLATASADAVMVNQVLHHLGDGEAAGWARTGAVLAEFARVLRPGGVLVVNICERAQLEHGWWYLALIPRAARAMIERHIPLERLQELMVEHGLEPRGRIVPLDVLLQGEAYFDALGPTRQGWRAGDSVWATVDAQEMANALDRIEGLRAVERLDGYLHEHDRERRRVGQTTFVYAVRQP